MSDIVRRYIVTGHEIIKKDAYVRARAHAMI